MIRTDDDADDDSVSDLDIYYNHKRVKHSRVPKYYSLKARTDHRSLKVNNKRSMSLCSLSDDNGVPNRKNNNNNNLARPDVNVAQIEKTALHNDIRRCSFSSRTGTNNFVVNPLFDENIDDYYVTKL